MPVSDRIIFLRLQRTSIFQCLGFRTFIGRCVVTIDFEPGDLFGIRRLEFVHGTEKLIKFKLGLQQRVEYGAEFPFERSLFTESHRRVDMTSHSQRIKQVEKSICALEHTLVKCP